MKMTNETFLKATLAIAIAVSLMTGCTSSSIVNTWMSPTYHGGAVKKVAVIGVDDRALVRQGFENRFVRDFRARGQEAVVTYDVLSLAEIKADKKGSEARAGVAGADSFLIVHLTDRTTNDRQVGPRPALVAESLVNGTGDTDGWEIYYGDAYVKLGTTWGRDSQTVYLSSSLHDFKSGRLLWSAVTKTVIKDDSDRLSEADKLIAMVVAAMRKDGVVR